VESNEVVASLSPHRLFASGTTYHFSDWRFVPALDEWMAARIEQHQPDGRLIRVWEFGEARPLMDGEFNEVTSIPSSDGADHARGGVTFTSVLDMRPGSQKQLLTMSDGTRVERQLPQSMLGTSRSSHWSVVIGWSCAAALAALLVGVKLFRNHRARAVRAP
jgi:hypothetical protein